MRALLAVCALLLAYVPAAIILSKRSLPDAAILSGPFIRYANSNAFMSFPVLPGALADEENHRGQSTLALYEDETLLGPAHSTNLDVQVDGRGRFSYWRHGTKMLLFSTSDNSDPNTNGRTYRVTDPRAHDPYQAQRR